MIRKRRITTDSEPWITMELEDLVEVSVEDLTWISVIFSLHFLEEDLEEIPGDAGLR